MDTKRLYPKILNYLAITVAAIWYAFTYYLFIINNNFAPAGFDGIATMIQYKTGFSIGYFSLIINIPLCVLAFFLVDKSFAKRTLFFCIVYSVWYIILQKVGFTDFQYNANGQDTIYPVILSGVNTGIVYGICLRANSSTGGTDIVSKFISKTKPEFNFFKVSFSINVIIGVISFFVYAQPTDGTTYTYDYKPICMCLIYCFITMFVGDFIIKGIKKAHQFTIITTHAYEIIDEISQKLRHSVTKITAVGSYSKDEKTVLICIVNRHQITDLKEILKKYDNTFSFSEIVSEVYGNFKYIK